jgi:hypothetical protein
MDLSLCANPEVIRPPQKTQRGISRYPASVLAPGSALGLLPSIALSSVQAGRIVIAPHELIETFIDLFTGEVVENLVSHVVSLAGFEVITVGRF